MSNINSILKNIKKNKIYISILKSKISAIKTVNKNHHKILHSIIIRDKSHTGHDNLLISRVLHVFCGKTNTNIHITNASGAIQFCCSAGSLSFKGKDKKRKNVVIKPMLDSLFKKSLFLLKENPFAMHLTNVGSFKQKVLKFVKNRHLINAVRDFNPFPHNGCRRRKLSRKKFKINTRQF